MIFDKWIAAFTHEKLTCGACKKEFSVKELRKALYICPECGKNLVVKSGRFGRFLACPGYPDCKNTKPLIEKTKGVCPKCGKPLSFETDALNGFCIKCTKESDDI